MINTEHLFNDIPANHAAILKQAFHLAADGAWEQGTLAPLMEYGKDQDHAPQAVVEFVQYIRWYIMNMDGLPFGNIYDAACGIMLAQVAEDMRTMFDYYSENYTSEQAQERMLREYGFFYDESWSQTVDYYAGLLYPHEMLHGPTPDNLQQMMIYMQEETNKADQRCLNENYFDTLAIVAGGHQITFPNTKENRFRFKKMLLEMSGSTHDPTGEVDWTESNVVMHNYAASANDDIDDGPVDGEDDEVFYSDTTGSNDAFKRKFPDDVATETIHDACPYDVTLESLQESLKAAEEAQADVATAYEPFDYKSDEVLALDGSLIEVGKIVTLKSWADVQEFLGEPDSKLRDEYCTLNLCVTEHKWSVLTDKQRTVESVYRYAKSVMIEPCILPACLIVSATNQSTTLDEATQAPDVATEEEFTV